MCTHIPTLSALFLKEEIQLQVIMHSFRDYNLCPLQMIKLAFIYILHIKQIGTK